MAGRPLDIAARLAGTAVLLLAAGGCLVNEDEFDQAQRRKEQMQAELARLRQGNDQLNQEIGRHYADREILSGHVALTAAVSLHNRLTARVRPAPPPAQPQTTRPAQTTRPTTVPPPPPGGGGRTPSSPPSAYRPGGGAVDWGQ